MADESLLSFPCELPVKVLGRNAPTFRDEARSIVRKHYAEIGEEAISVQHSRNETYLAMTFIVSAQSREEVDALYRELTASDEILMVL